MKLSTLAVTLGILMSLKHLYGLINPTAFAAAAKRFPRSLPWGYFLMGLGTAWFLWNVNAETITDFASYKKIMLLGFGAVGVLTCVYVKDYLAVRGLSVVALLLAKLMLDTARPHDSQWRLVIVVWAYLLILGGMWFIISPWRLRDLLNWATATEQRVRLGSAFRLGFALLLVLLGLTQF